MFFLSSRVNTSHNDINFTGDWCELNAGFNSVLFLVSIMSHQDNLAAGVFLDSFDLPDVISHHEGCSLKLDDNLHGHSCFERELSFEAESKHRNKTTDLNNAYVDHMNKKMGNLINEDQMAESKEHADDILDSDTEDLRHALEADLNIIGAARTNFNLSQCNRADEISCKDRKKKRKKHRGPVRRPHQIFAFNEDEQQKIQQGKTYLDMKKQMTGKGLCKSATFPGSEQLIPSSKFMTNVKIEQFEDITMHGNQCEFESPELKDSLYIRTNSLPASFKLIPAVRGGHEQIGLGPRPKLSVKWAPDVQEPPCSSVSHTVRSHHRHQSKKKDQKLKHKVKSNHASGNDKNDKYFTCNPRYSIEGAPSRVQSSSVPQACDRIVLDVLPSRGSMLMPDKSRLVALKAPLFDMHMGQNTILVNMASEPTKQCNKNGEDGFTGKYTNDFLSESKDNLLASSDAEFLLFQDSKCASSFLRTLQNKQLSFAEAM